MNTTNPKAYKRHKATAVRPPTMVQLALRAWSDHGAQCHGCWRCAPERFAKPGARK